MICKIRFNIDINIIIIIFYLFYSYGLQDVPSKYLDPKLHHIYDNISFTFFLTQSSHRFIFHSKLSETLSLLKYSRFFRTCPIHCSFVFHYDQSAKQILSTAFNSSAITAFVGRDMGHNLFSLKCPFPLGFLISIQYDKLLLFIVEHCLSNITLPNVFLNGFIIIKYSLYS